MTLGPLMVGIEAAELDQCERELLLHPCVGGVILFSRNYRCPAQLRALCDSIHSLRRPPLLVAVDQEGGRVQRFRGGFTVLPSAARYGELYDRSPGLACRAARAGGLVMAAELRACGVDFSLAPVLDLDRGTSTVIGDRAFHHDPDAVTELARAFLDGMRDGGSVGVGKHFPGHGGVSADSHYTLPVDGRPYQDIRLADLVPFERLAASGLAGVMPAHVVFECVDSDPAGFSRRWLQGILRGVLGFQGIIFSDDLDMAAAAVGGNHVERSRAALDAGCDVVLVCNDRQAALSVVDGLEIAANPVRNARLATMHGHGAGTYEELSSSLDHRRAVAELLALIPESEPEFGDGGFV